MNSCPREKRYTHKLLAVTSACLLLAGCTTAVDQEYAALEQEILKIEAENTHARDWLKAYDIKAMRSTIASEQERERRAIPWGPIDVQVGSWLDRTAADVQITDLKWYVPNGIKPPAKHRLEMGDRAGRPFYSSAMDVTFSGRPDQVQDFVGILTSSQDNRPPWEFWVSKLRWQIVPPPKKSRKYSTIAIQLTVNYLYQFDPALDAAVEGSKESDTSR